MEDYRNNFIDETTGLLDKFEESLLKIEDDPNNIELINELFRIVHSIKGAAGMFGFLKIQETTHSVENLLSEIKEGYIQINSDIINICFDLIDYIIKTFENRTEFDLASLQLSILFKVNNFIEFKPVIKQSNEEESTDFKTIYILFHPNSDFETRGINLANSLKDIESLGEYIKFERVFVSEDKESQDSKFYMFWEYIISTNKRISEIEDIFIFFENQHTIKVLAESNLLMNKEFSEKIEKIDSEQINIDELQEISSEFVAKIPKKELIKFEPKLDENTSDTKLAVSSASFQKYKTSIINVESVKLDTLMNVVSELITAKEGLKIIAKDKGMDSLSEVSERIEKISRTIQNIALGLRLIPIKSIMSKFERLIKNLSKDLGKQIKFDTDGTNTELDKTIIDNIVEPMMHIFRNSIDHGIEFPEERIKKGKNETGRIKFFASYSGNNVIIQIHDDGCGIDAEKIKRKGIEKGHFMVGANPSKKEIMNLLFLPGFTTSTNVTDISGRGVGMDVVRQKILDLRGDVEIDSEIDLGTYITIKLPLTLSIVDTLQVIINKVTYLIPKNVVSTIVGISLTDLADKYYEYYTLNGEPVPVLDLKQKFGTYDDSRKLIKIIFVTYKDKNYGLVCDDILGEHQAVLKPLGKMFKSKETFSGASILGDGTLALMIDTNKLIETRLLQQESL